MDSQSEQVDVVDREYDGRYGKRWYYRLYSVEVGEWFWEPRLPRPAEIVAARSQHRGTRESMLVTHAEWPSREQRGPYCMIMRLFVQ